jgi:hypothetical protein
MSTNVGIGGGAASPTVDGVEQGARVNIYLPAAGQNMSAAVTWSTTLTGGQTIKLQYVLAVTAAQVITVSARFLTLVPSRVS